MPADEAAAARLREARIAAKYSGAELAAKAMGVKVSTYGHHENATAGFSRHAERYARFFRVNLEWLLTGRGEMRPGKGESLDMDQLEFAKAFGRAPAWAQRIIEGVLKEAESLTGDDKRPASPDVPYAQEESAPSSLQDRPKRLRGGPDDDGPAIDQKAIDAALARQPKRPPKGRGKPKRR
jgi:hypothetical protein